MTGTVLDPKVEETTTTGDPIMSHLVPPKDGKTGPQRVMEARVNGTPVEACCGYVWIPSRDPRNYPLCQKCEQIYKERGGGPVNES